MNDQSKYWTRLERYTPTGDSLWDWDGDFECIWYDIEPLKNFTLSEKQWLHKNLDKWFIVNCHLRNKDEYDQIIATSKNSDIDFETAAIEFKAVGGLVRRHRGRLRHLRRLGGHWALFKHKDDWFYCLKLIEDYPGPDDSQLYKCDGFLGLKKLLEHLDLLK